MTAYEAHFSREQWEKLVQETVDRVLFLGRHKGMEYSGPNDDFLGNIRSQATDLGINMELIWGVLAGKQWNAVRTYILDVVKGEQRERSEPIEGRVDDLITYLLLFKALIREREERQKPTTGNIKYGVVIHTPTCAASWEPSI